MCFSANVSFGTSVIVGFTGIIAIKKANTTPQRLFAAIPLIFSIQQLSEGILWLAIKSDDLVFLQHLSTYIFLVFAKVVWPTWVPLTIMLLEKESKRKKTLSLFLWAGIVVSVCLACSILFFPINVESFDHHIYYRFDLPKVITANIWIIEILYFVATVISSFVSGIRRMKLLGLVFMIAYLFARVFYDDFIVSVWCFFAAILSGVVLWIILEPVKSLTRQGIDADLIAS